MMILGFKQQAFWNNKLFVKVRFIPIEELSYSDSFG